MSEQIEIQPCGPVTGHIRPPGSKSITNRALVCAALAGGKSRLNGVLRSEDTQVMIDGLGLLGIAVTADSDDPRQLEVTGCAGVIPVATAEIYVANSGTTVRFLTAMVSLGEGHYRLDGVDRMRKRPIEDLLGALRQLGAEVRSEHGDGCPPVLARSQGLTGGHVTLRGDISSQFLSGLLMTAPYAREPVEIAVQGPLVSQPYVDMTLAVMRAFGVEVKAERARLFRIAAPAQYHARRYEIEPDASAASYFWAAAAITGGRVTVDGLTTGSLQGDVRFCDCLRQMGCQVIADQRSLTVQGGPLRGIDVDMNAISDTVQTLAAVALFAKGPTRITGVAHIRHKETDRIGDLARELRRLGAAVDEAQDGLTIQPGALHGATVQTYDDHRMAMSLALVGLQVPGVVVLNPGCTAKTYPDFFRDLQALSAPR